MHAFTNILVGVDLSHGERAAAAVCQAIRSAVWLAAESSASVTFVSILARSAPQSAADALGSLARHAEKTGVRAIVEPHSQGTAADIIRLVQRNHHDLVMVGAPDDKGLVSALFGNEITRLIHTCSCPVWLAVPGVEFRPRNVLIASDLTPISDNALRLGLRLARTLDVRAHLLHVVDYPLDHHWTTGDGEPESIQYHWEVREAAAQALREQLALIPESDGPRVELHVIGRSGVPEFEIVQFIREHRIDLAVMGDSPRHGLLVTLFGNTTDWVLPELPCSLLVVKPSDLPASPVAASLSTAPRFQVPTSA